MRSFLKIIGVAMIASLFGTIANGSSAETTPSKQAGMPPGMMGGYGPGHGMGRGMMGDYGPGYGMSPEMVGRESYRGLGLNSDQKSKITRIQKEMRTKHWAVMGQMMDAQDKLQDLLDADKQDSSAINKQYKSIEDLQRKMVDSSVDAHNRINDILTKEQREKSRESARGYSPMMRGWGY